MFVLLTTMLCPARQEEELRAQWIKEAYKLGFAVTPKSTVRNVWLLAFIEVDI